MSFGVTSRVGVVGGTPVYPYLVGFNGEEDVKESDELTNREELCCGDFAVGDGGATAGGAAAGGSGGGGMLFLERSGEAYRAAAEAPLDAAAPPDTAATDGD